MIRPTLHLSERDEARFWSKVALRALRIRGRWITTLRAILARLDRQLTERPAGDDWRRRAQVFRHNIAERLAEAEALRDRDRCAS